MTFARTVDRYKPARSGAGIAFDRQQSARHYDEDGRLHIASSNFSMAAVNEYLGSEIPGFQALCLDHSKIYRLCRDPQELAKGAASFNNLPILSRHVPVDARDHRPDLVVGSLGSDVTFDGIFLRASMVVWAQSAIDAIASGARRELSAAYRYEPDFTPGIFQGQPYDAVMRRLVGNHVALVESGRAGSAVVVGDAARRRLRSFEEMFPHAARIKIHP